MVALRGTSPCGCLVFIFLLVSHSFSQKTCPKCGALRVPYPLSTDPACGDREYYSFRCDPTAGRLYFNALNGSSYLIIQISAAAQKMVVQPSPWIGDTCVTKDAQVSEGLMLNQSLPFNVTSSNTVFLLNCSPRLLVSPLNCTPSSLCHQYLEGSGHVEKGRAGQCASGLSPCCTFQAGGMPSAYKIRLHTSGCRAFRSILHLDPQKPPDQWEEGLEIQWAPPPEPICRSQNDCSRNSQCSPASPDGLVHRCLCKKDYEWDRTAVTCLRKKKELVWSDLRIEVSVGTVSFLLLALAVCIIAMKKSRRFTGRAKLAKSREDMLKSSNGGKAAKLFTLKEVRKATCNFAREWVLGSGGFGEVYRGQLSDGTVVAVKSAKVGNIKSTQQVLNEVRILSQVNHKNLVKLIGCCVEAEQPLMVYEYIPNGTLHDHLHGKLLGFLDWNMRLRVALQTAEALAYLHSAAYTPIYHRDVKSTNILLDQEFNAKVADFGLSRLALPGLSHVSTCAQGTVGYLDPEYYRSYQLTDKSDVYSFGVVLLELLTSQKAIDFSRDPDDINLAIYAGRRAHNGTLMEVVDTRVLGEEPSPNTFNSVKLFSELAFACLKEKKQDRPSMKDVAQEIQGIIQALTQTEDAQAPTEVSDN